MVHEKIPHEIHQTGLALALLYGVASPTTAQISVGIGVSVARVNIGVNKLLGEARAMNDAGSGLKHG